MEGTEDGDGKCDLNDVEDRVVLPADEEVGFAELDGGGVVGSLSGSGRGGRTGEFLVEGTLTSSDRVNGEVVRVGDDSESLLSGIEAEGGRGLLGQLCTFFKTSKLTPSLSMIVFLRTISSIATFPLSFLGSSKTTPSLPPIANKLSSPLSTHST